MRLLAPAALIVFGLLFLVVVVGSIAGGSGSGESADQSDSSGESDGGSGAQPRASSYRVRPGDTLGSISERTGRTPEQLQDLNPGLDAQALQPGQRLKLRE